VKVLMMHILILWALILGLAWLETRHYRQHYPEPPAKRR